MFRGVGAFIPLNPAAVSSVTSADLDEALMSTDPAVYNGNNAGASEPIEAPMPGQYQAMVQAPGFTAAMGMSSLVLLGLIGVSVWALAKG